MSEFTKTRVFMSGQAQYMTIPAEFCVLGEEAYVRRDTQTGDLIVSQTPQSWDEIYAALDRCAFPEDFLRDREQGQAAAREKL